MSERASSGGTQITVVEAMLHLPEEGFATKVLVQQLEATEFKVWSYPFFAQSVAVRDVFEGEVLVEPDPITGLDRIALKHVIFRAGWNSYDVLCLEALVRSAEFQACLSHVHERGGFTENLGDLYVFYWPPEVHLEPEKLLEALPRADALRLQADCSEK
jgi:hypothetical protein